MLANKPILVSTTICNAEGFISLEPFWATVETWRCNMVVSMEGDISAVQCEHFTRICA